MLGVRVDAQSGEVLMREDLTRDAVTASYRVFDPISPRPQATAYNYTPTSPEPAVSAQTDKVVSTTLASPDGWIGN